MSGSNPPQVSPQLLAMFANSDPMSQAVSANAGYNSPSTSPMMAGGVPMYRGPLPSPIPMSQGPNQRNTNAPVRLNMPQLQSMMNNPGGQAAPAQQMQQPMQHPMQQLMQAQAAQQQQPSMQQAQRPQAAGGPNPSVAQFQSIFNKLTGMRIPVDGLYGPETAKAKAYLTYAMGYNPNVGLAQMNQEIGGLIARNQQMQQQQLQQPMQQMPQQPQQMMQQPMQRPMQQQQMPQPQQQMPQQPQPQQQMAQAPRPQMGGLY